MELSRRDFIKLCAAAGVAAGAVVIVGETRYFRVLAASPDPAGAAEGQLLEEFIRSTDSPNCTGACGFVARVVDGRIATLIQAADYPEDEYNPRGCLRGLSMMNLIYGKDRLKYPLIRTGPRGSGEFRRASWEEALDYAAAEIKKITVKYGPQSVATTVQVGGTGYVQKGAWVRLAGLAAWTIHHAYDQNGDLPVFWPMTFGVQTAELESLEWRNAKYTMIFGSNPLVTRLPDAQHLIAAKRNGKLVVFDPDCSATASKADEWIRVEPDSDASLALGMAAVIVKRKLYDEAFLSDFTDMPVLVRKDTGKRLQAGDVPALKKQAAKIAVPEYRGLFVVKTKSGFAPLNPQSLQPTGATLEGTWDVTLADGKTVAVSTVFSELKKELANYPLDRVSGDSGVAPETIERLAVECATAKPLHIIYGASGYQWYHGDLKGRALALLPVLTGNIGQSGSGISTYAGQYKVRFNLHDWWYATDAVPNWVPYLYFLQGEGPIYPENGIKAMISGWGNPFDQHNMSNILKNRATSGELEFIMTTDIQMTTTCQWSDVVFPASSWYEKLDVTATPAHPYVQLQQPAIKPMFESKSELWIARELAKRLDPKFEKFYYPKLDEGAAAEAAIRLVLETGGPNVAGMTYERLQKGPVRLHSSAPGDRQVPFYDQVHKRVPFPPESPPAPIEATSAFIKSGRIEFYKDEDEFLRLGEQLPVHKETFLETEYKADPGAREKYKLRLITRNSLYRVHSTHSNNAWLNELQNDKPKVFLSGADAAERGIVEGELVEIFNGRGKTNGYAVLSDAAKPGVVIFEQGWWAKYLRDESYNSLTMPWIKSTHEVYFVPGIWSPNTCWNECLVDVRTRS